MTFFILRWAEFSGEAISPDGQGKGVGKQLFKHSIHFATESGYSGIQLNIGVSTNKVAVELWKKYGFHIIGAAPKGFKHTDLSFVATYMMYKEPHAAIGKNSAPSAIPTEKAAFAYSQQRPVQKTPML